MNRFLRNMAFAAILGMALGTVFRWLRERNARR